MFKDNEYPNFMSIFSEKPKAVAIIKGSKDFTNIDGRVWFYKMENATLVVAQIKGLPHINSDCESPIFAFHIHQGTSCTGNDIDAFANALTHYNPNNCPHPYHSGDLPPLFSANGYAFSSVLTDRFEIEEIIGRTVIIHSSVDDFVSQPSGNAGNKIACGQILPL